MDNFENIVTMTDIDRSHAAHQRPNRSNKLVVALWNSVAENPNESYRQRAQHFGAYGSTLGYILKDNLHFIRIKFN